MKFFSIILSNKICLPEKYVHYDTIYMKFQNSDNSNNTVFEYT